MTRGGVLGGAVLLLGTMGACAHIPESGPVRAGSSPGGTSSVAPFDFSPPGPTPGATPEQVVSGFLTAQQATPASSSVARAFLTERADEMWKPESATLMYRNADVTGPSTASGEVPVSVRISLERAFALDSTGRWSGRRRVLEGQGLLLSVISEQGEWRIADPPDALMLPLSHVDNRFQRLSVYFADPTGNVLVPEPIYLPTEVQTPTQLVEALLAGPQGRERRADRSFLPTDSELQVSVPVSASGVAQVPLSGELLELDRGDLMVAVAQLVWTLRQMPEISAVSVTADGEQVVVPDIGVEVPVTALDQYSPLGFSSASDLYGLRGRSVMRVVKGETSVLLRLPASSRPDDLAVSLLGNPVAVADASGTVGVFARASEDERRRARPVRSIETGPVAGMGWDWSRTLWLVTRRVDGGVRAVVGDRVKRLAWPDSRLDGRRVQSFAVSRDGTRVVLAVPDRARRGSELWSARVARSANESVGPVALWAARRIRTASPLSEVVEIGWKDAQTVAALVKRDRLSSRVVAVPVDGQAQGRVLSGDSDVLFGNAVDMAVSPSNGEAVVVTADGQVYVLSEQGRWRLDSGVGRLPRSLTFVG